MHIAVPGGEALSSGGNASPSLYDSGLRAHYSGAASVGSSSPKQVYATRNVCFDATQSELHIGVLDSRQDSGFCWKLSSE